MFQSFSGIKGGRSRSNTQEGRQSSGSHPFGSEDARRLDEADYVRWEVRRLPSPRPRFCLIYLIVAVTPTAGNTAVTVYCFINVALLDSGLKRSVQGQDNDKGRCIQKHVLGVGLYAGVLCFGAHGGIVPVPEVVENGHMDCLAVPREAVEGVAGGSLPAVAPVPWAGGGKHNVVSVICDTAWKTGSLPTDDWQAPNPRVIARRQLEKLRDMGYTLKSAHEYEFRLFDPETLEPVIKGNDIFNTLVLGEYEEALMAVEGGLRAQGVMVETMQTEAGSAQFELTLAPCQGLDAADAAFRFKHAVKEMFQQRRVIASFMTKPVEGEASNSCHFNHSLQPLREAGGLFSDGRLDEEVEAGFKYVDGELNDLASHWLGGLVKHAPALSALCAPTANCYRRLHGAWAPSHGGWGEENRDMMVRLKRDGEEGCYFENRLGCGASNPYLVMAATVAAGLDGLRTRLPPPPPDTKEACPELPQTLPDALDALEKDAYMVGALGEQFVRWFRLFKEAEMKTVDEVHRRQRGDRLEAEKTALLRFL